GTDEGDHILGDPLNALGGFGRVLLQRGFELAPTADVSGNHEGRIERQDGHGFGADLLNDSSDDFQLWREGIERNSRDVCPVRRTLHLHRWEFQLKLDFEQVHFSEAEVFDVPLDRLRTEVEFGRKVHEKGGWGIAWLALAG